MTHVDSMLERKKEDKERSRDWDIEAACMRYKSGAVRPLLGAALALVRRRRQRSTPLAGLR
jgi:hypothetical protein